MRDILFRGKSVSNNEWVEGYYEFSYMYDSLRECHRIIWADKPTRTNFLSEVIPETVGQYTGLTDKNDKKIFEGDILSSSWGYKGVVEFDQITYAKLECLFNEDCEIIGNIYDNPELQR